MIDQDTLDDIIRRCRKEGWSMNPPERFPPDDPREWLNRARSNLAMARNRVPGAYLEDLCFQAQQAAEKDGFYVGSVPGLPGCHTQGTSIDQLIERMEEAIALWLEVEGGKGEDAPSPLELVGIQRISV